MFSPWARVGLQTGTRLKVRILEADVSRRRVTVTAKKTLLNSKLPIVATVGTAPGTVTHGYVTGLEHYGVFVSFYGGCKGLARLADLGLAQDQTPNDAFALHQVVKAKVLGADPNKGGRLRLSLDAGAVGASTADVAAAAAAFELGDVVTGRVAAAVPTAADGPLDVLIQKEDGSGAEVRALLDATHLSDHPAAAAVLRAALAPGTPLGRLVVLERRDAAGGGAGWRVSRKASLVALGAGACCDSQTVGDCMREDRAAYSGGGFPLKEDTGDDRYLDDETDSAKRQSLSWRANYERQSRHLADVLPKG